jgi:hypothetical protein
MSGHTGEFMRRKYALCSVPAVLICCAAVMASPSSPRVSAPKAAAAPAVDSAPPKLVTVNVASLPAAGLTTIQTSTPVAVRVDNWPEHETDWSAVSVAVFTAVLAVATILLAGATFRLWKSTKALAEETSDTARRQLRAYVFPIQFQKPPGASTAVVVTFKNLGNTPAYGIAVAARAELAGSEDYLTQVTDAGPALGILAPGTVTTVRAQESIAIPNNPTPAEIDSATFALYVHGRVDYTDTFGKKRWSRFRQVYRDGQLVVCRSGNDADDFADSDGN